MRQSGQCNDSRSNFNWHYIYFGHPKREYKRLSEPLHQIRFCRQHRATEAVITLNFQIFKQCKGQLAPIPVGSVWTYSRLIAVTESDSFRFFSCDCNICDDECCVYSVVATVTGILPEINETIGSAVINNASLSAIIADNM